MNREEKKKLIDGFVAYVLNRNPLKTPPYDEEVGKYLDSLEMNKEKAIKEIQGILSDNLNVRIIDEEEEQALKFAIDYMKDEGEIIGWVNYYPDKDGDKFCGIPYHTIEIAKENAVSFYGNCIQIPIRLPKP